MSMEEVAAETKPWLAWTRTGPGHRANNVVSRDHGTLDGARTLCGKEVGGDERGCEWSPEATFACQRCKSAHQKSRHSEVQPPAEIVSPTVAQGPYTVQHRRILSAEGKWIGEAYPFETSESIGTATAQAHLFAASWDLLAVCDEAIRNAEPWDDLDADSLAILTRMRAAVARARGFRHCDDPALVPDVMKAQPQCVHGERVVDELVYGCEAHPDSGVGTLRHGHHSGGVWYTYVSDGYMNEHNWQKGSGG